MHAQGGGLSRDELEWVRESEVLSSFARAITNSMLVIKLR